MGYPSNEFYIGSLNLSGFRVRPMSYKKTDYFIRLELDFGILTALPLIKLDIIRDELLFLHRLDTSFYFSYQKMIWHFYLKRGWRYAFATNGIEASAMVRFRLDAGIYSNG